MSEYDRIFFFLRLCVTFIGTGICLLIRLFSYSHLHCMAYVMRTNHPRTTKVLIEHLPAVRKIAEDVLELVFTPRAIARQFVLAIALETGALTAEQLLKALRAVSANFSSRARLIRQLRLEQSEASTQDDWMDLAERIDSIQGNDLWRSEPDCPLYEADRISARIDELVHLMRRRDIFDLMFVLRGGIARNKFGLLHEGLFSKALAGSKMLVETYHNVVCGALDFVCDAPVLEGDEPIPTEAVSFTFNRISSSLLCFVVGPSSAYLFRMAYNRTHIMFYFHQLINHLGPIVETRLL